MDDNQALLQAAAMLLAGSVRDSMTTPPVIYAPSDAAQATAVRVAAQLFNAIKRIPSGK